MKLWNKDDLILFYYGELTPEQNESLRTAMSESEKLQLEYAELCDFLDNEAEYQVPAPSKNFDQQIMAAIYQQSEARQSTQEVTPSEKLTFWKAIAELTNPRVLATAFTLSFVVIGIFFLGRWSTQMEQVPEYVELPQQQIEPSPNDEQLAQQSRRVLFSNVSSHLEKSSRLFTLVSNGNGDLAEQIDSRRQTIEELVALNRLYRRIAAASGDNQLANVLQQMESILVELNHTSPQAQSNELQNIKQRVEDGDLIYRLKVTNQKLTQKII